MGLGCGGGGVNHNRATKMDWPMFLLKCASFSCGESSLCCGPLLLSNMG